jgi:hypothetical protein
VATSGRCKSWRNAPAQRLLRSNLAALELDVDPELEQLNEDPAVYWQERSALPWN